MQELLTIPALDGSFSSLIFDSHYIIAESTQIIYGSVLNRIRDCDCVHGVGEAVFASHVTSFEWIKTFDLQGLIDCHSSDFARNVPEDNVRCFPIIRQDMERDVFVF